MPVDIVHGSLPRLFLDKVSKIVGRETELRRAVVDRRQSAVHVVLLEIVIEQYLKLGEQRAVDGLAGHKLTLVETLAVIDKDFDIRADQLTGHAVDVMVELILDKVETLNERRALFLRQMQRLVHLIREEAIVLDVLAKRCATDKLGVEEKSVALRLEDMPVILNAYYLTGSETDHIAFVVVILRIAIDDLAILLILQKNGIEAHGVAHGMHGLALAHVDDADQRMKCLNAKSIVKLLYRLKVHDCLLVLFHISASCCPMQRYNNFSVYLFSFNFFRVFRLDDILLSRVDKVLLALSYPPASINLHVFVVIADGVECNHILAILIVDEGGKGIGGARGVSIVLEMTCWPF